MDLVYVCRAGHNEELRYSIRSAEKNLKFDNLWVVGGKPDWYSGKHIEVPQNSGKYENTKENVSAIAKSKEISDRFILMNDDFYVIKEVEDVQNFNGGKLLDKANMYDRLAYNSSYTQRLFDTYAKLRKMGFEDPLDFEMHVPIVIDKAALRHSVKYNLLWRSIYGNVYQIPSSKMDEDVKVYMNSPLDPKSYDMTSLKYPYLSSDDRSFVSVYKAVLKDMFREPSSYER